MCVLCDDVDELVEHESGSHLLTATLDECVLDARETCVFGELVESSLVRDFLVGFDDELLVVTVLFSCDQEAILLEFVLKVRKFLPARVVVLITSEEGVAVAELVRGLEEHTDRASTSDFSEKFGESGRAGALLDTLRETATLDENAIVRTDAAGVGDSIGEEDRVDDLDIVRSAECGNDLESSSDGFVERSTTESKGTGNRCVPVSRGSSKVHCTDQSRFEFTLVHLRGEEVEQAELAEDSTETTV